MKYKNIKTGAIIDSPNKIKGKFWEPLEKEFIEEVEEKKEIEDTPEVSEDFEEEEIDLQSMTIKELEELAIDEDIELTAEDKKNKDARIAAIVAALG